MRKLVPFLLCLSVIAKGQNFTPGNIVVLRSGNGIIAINGGLAAPVFLDEYTQSGTPVRSIAMPNTPSPTIKMLTNNGASISEGFLNISADGQYLTLCGYNATVGTSGGTAVGGAGMTGNIDNSTSSYINRVVGIVDYAGNVNTTTALTNTYDNANFRSAVTDNGTNLWLSGNVYNTMAAVLSAGIRYTTSGSTTSLKISAPAFDNERAISIANNQLYVSNGSGNYQTINTLGVGLPTTAGQTAANLSGMPDGSQVSPEGFIFFDMDPAIAGPDLLYVCDDGSVNATQGLNKYAFDGTVWTKKGKVLDDCTGVTGYVGCDGKVVLFITSSANSNNKIYKFIDNAAYNAIITNDGSAISSVGKILATAGLKQVFRGIQMAPGPGLTLSGTSTIAIGNYNKITIKSGANVTLAGNVAIADKLVVETGATLDCGSFIISSANNTAGYFELQTGAILKIGSVYGITATAASGNIQTCSRRFNSGANYEYNATAAQNTGDGLPAIITGTLTLNNAANITLSSNVKVSGTINFNAGKLMTSITNAITVTSLTKYDKYPTSYNQTTEETSFIDGPLQFESSANTYQILPIGKGSHFAPVGIMPFNSIIKTYTAEYFPITPTDYLNVYPSIDHISKLEYWDIGCTATTNPEMDAKITLYWSPNSVVGHAGNDGNALADLRIAHYMNTGTGITWQMDGAASLGFTKSGTIDYGKISANDYASHFSPFTLASSSYRNLLPVQLLKFNAVQTNNKVRLQWQTTDESDMDNFTVERSQDGQNYNALKSLSATNTTGINNYELVDENPTQRLNFYRLSMMGKNGRKDYSAIEKIWLNEDGKIMLYPNPVKDFVYIKLPIADGTLLLTDPAGKLLKIIKVDNNLMRLGLQNLPAGNYYVFYEGLGGKGNLKFIKLVQK